MDGNPYERYWGSTYLHPVGLIAILVLGIALLFVQRRSMPLPMLVMACFVSPAQQVAVLSLNFDLLRIMVIFAWVRLLARREYLYIRWNSLDMAIVAWAAAGTFVYTISYGTPEALKYKLGTTYDALGMYFLFRCVIRNFDDLRHVVRGVTIIAVPVALAFIVERLTAQNPFAFFGGVRATTWVRDGKLRCQGAFAHAILAGCFWAALIPMMASLYWDKVGSRVLAILGVASGLIVIVACNSSTPMSAVLVSAFAGSLYFFRQWVPLIRLGAVLLAISLHFAMNAPIWHLISRIDIAGGSTGWHRFFLIDQAIKHFPEWWLLGTHDTEHWGQGLHDVTNQYVLEGVRGGAVTLVLFCACLCIAFRYVGRLISATPPDAPRRIMAWALGTSLFTHCVIFVGVSYFGQIEVIWYMLLATIGSLGGAAVTSHRPVEQRVTMGRARRAISRGTSVLKQA